MMMPRWNSYSTSPETTPYFREVVGKLGTTQGAKEAKAWTKTSLLPIPGLQTDMNSMGEYS